MSAGTKLQYNSYITTETKHWMLTPSPVGPILLAWAEARLQTCLPVPSIHTRVLTAACSRKRCCPLDQYLQSVLFDTRHGSRLRQNRGLSGLRPTVDVCPSVCETERQKYTLLPG